MAPGVITAAAAAAADLSDLPLPYDLLNSSSESPIPVGYGCFVLFEYGISTVASDDCTLLADPEIRPVTCTPAILLRWS